VSAEDQMIARVRAERDAAIAAIQAEIDDCYREADRLTEKRDAVHLDFDTRIGDLHKAAQRAGG
jgi:hypothetical protein